MFRRLSGENMRVDAQQVIEALRKLHPASEPGFAGPGRWTTLQEWENVDLVALDAWSPSAVIGYEVKVSRGDYRSELLKPRKRARAVARCTQFYFAVPHGMLKAEEVEWAEPSWRPQDYVREACPGVPALGQRLGGPCHGRGRRGTGPYRVQVPVPTTERYGGETLVTCPTCGGKGYVALSAVELGSPTLWVPRDVGLVEVTPDGLVRVRKRAPKRKPEPFVAGPQELARLVRWASFRPDPRHEAERRAAAPRRVGAQEQLLAIGR